MDKERAKAGAACEKGDGPSCFVAGMGLDYTNKAQLERAMVFWRRGCELGNGASCAQLGTVAEFGMTTGGGKPDAMGAARYYALACERGHHESCKKLGLVDPNADAAAAADAAKAMFSWREALTPVCGRSHGEMGPLFAGLVPGQPMSDAMKQAIAAFENKFKAHVHYYAGDPMILSNWSLDVSFDEKEGIWPVLVKGWGQPDLPFGAWASDQAHVIAYWMHNDQSSGVSWNPYRSVAEVIRPDDQETLGFEPGFPVVGAKLVDLQKVMERRMLRSADDEYRWNEIGPGPNFEVRVVEKRGVIVELRTVNWITNSPELGDTLLGALETKWGKFKVDKNGVRTWLLKGRRVQASKPASGNFELVITKR